MAIFESFDTSKNKIRKTWERSDQNTDNLNDVPLTTVDFNSVNFNKQLTIFPIITDQLVNSNRNISTITLKNFPEWAINMIEVTCFYTMEDAYTEFPVIDSPPPITSRIGQLVINTQEFKYWFNRIDNKDFYLKIYHRVSLRQFIKGGFSFGNPVPLNITLSLRILNKRIYEKMNSKKE